MNESTPQLTSKQRLTLLKRKRHALEQLIEFSKNISSQTNALEDVMVLIRPSQQIDDTIRQDVMYMVETLQNLSEDELQQRLSRVDELVQEGIQAIIDITESVEDTEFDNQTIKEQIQQIRILIRLFKKRTELSLALRIVLQERGIVPERLHIEFSQETIVEHVQQLKEEEHKCRATIRNHIEDVIIDCNTMLNFQGISDDLSGELKQVKLVMQQNLEHIDAGNSIENLPINFEAIELGESSPGLDEELFNEQPQPTTTTEPNNPSEPAHSKQDSIDSNKEASLLKRASTWLNTPWNVSWKETKEDEDKSN